MAADDELEPVRRAVEGLTYPSETDAPFEVFRWEDASARAARDAVASRVGKRPAMQHVSLDSFFSPLDDAEGAARYRELRRVLESALGGLEVWRVGEVRVAVYLVGRTTSGAWAGVRTVSVET